MMQAEGEGFEPSVPTKGTPVFKTGAFVRSANPPWVVGRNGWIRRVRTSLQICDMPP